MCGIAGVIAETDLDPGDLALLERINARLFHRGPDSGGVFKDGPVAIAMRRLSIVDISGGAQPLFTEDRSKVLVCNGEIYNHKELRKWLVGAGHRLGSHSDVETILHLYEERGAAAVEALDGMYAFALWDSTRRTLLLGRDRLGEKPLYIWRDRRADGVARLWFASELRALLEVIPPSARRLSRLAFAQFMTFQYLVEPVTPLEGMSQLPPAHVLELTPQNLEARPKRYWGLSTIAAREESDPVGLVRATLDTACLRMGSADVPVGVALSGGIDSSLVAALTARHYPGQIHAFSVGYPGRPVTDERDIAERFARRLGIPFTSIELDTAGMATDFPDLVAAMDTPVADIAAAGYFAVAKAAREAGIPVLLSGLGGDEMFWGYDWTRAAAVKLGRGPSFVDRLMHLAVEPETSILAWHPDLKAGAALAQALTGAGVAPDHWLRETRPDANLPSGLAVIDIVDRTWLLGNCLTLLDRISMAHSIEMRLPFLDIPLVNAVCGMRRAGLADHVSPHKSLLLAAHGQELPDEITHRPKQGFTPPVGEWIAAINAASQHALLPDGPLAISGLADPDQLARALPRLTPVLRFKLSLYAVWLREVVL